MAIYHLETKVVSRGTGRSAVAAAAYMSCSQILNDYDGVQHDFTRKKGLSGSKYFCRSMPLSSGRNGQFSGTPWKKMRKRKTADSPVNL